MAAKFAEMPDIDLWGLTGYEPSVQAAAFHESDALRRYLIWGIKGGKTYAGAHEFLAMVFEKARLLAGRRQKLLFWVVAPTNAHLDTCEKELEELFDLLEEKGLKLRKKVTKRPRKTVLIDGTAIEFRSGEIPENLRGPNVDGVWCDEFAFLRELSWIQVIQRTSQRQGPIIGTTTPDGRNFVWRDCCEAGMPPGAPYGIFTNVDQPGDIITRFVSHYRTEDFPWVPKAYVDDARRTLPRIEFDRDYLALFLSGGKNVFRYIEESFHRIPTSRTDPPRDVSFVIGVDLAKQQDFSVMMVMDGDGVVWDIKRFNGVDYQIQKERIRRLAKKWNNAVCIMDSANVGESIADDLVRMDVKIHRVNMHSPQVKRDIIEALQVAFDGKSGVRIPDPESPYAPEEAKTLYSELQSYEASVTSGGRISYSAPKRMNDDCVVGLALAYWGKKHGLSSGGASPASVAMARDEYMQGFEKEVRELPTRRARQYQGRIFNRPGILGARYGGRFWN